jgi:hypothetical protein
MQEGDDGVAARPVGCAIRVLSWVSLVPALLVTALLAADLFSSRNLLGRDGCPSTSEFADLIFGVSIFLVFVYMFAFTYVQQRSAAKADAVRIGIAGSVLLVGGVLILVVSHVTGTGYCD